MFNWLDKISALDIVNWVSYFVFAMSVITLLAPPIEWFDDYPKFQKKYKFALLVIAHYAALNFRAALWSKYIDMKSMKDPQP